MNIKGVHLLNSTITNFARSLGCTDVTFIIGTEFAYYPFDNTITYPLWQIEKADKCFIKYLRNQHYVAIDKKLNPFILSLLHEIGHYFTIEDIEEYVLLKCLKKKQREQKRISKRKCPLSKKQFEKKLFKYWDLPDELNANAMALYLLKNNRKRVKQFQNELADKFELFYKINGVKM